MSGDSTVQVKWQVLVSVMVVVALVGAGVGAVLGTETGKTAASKPANVTGLVSENAVASYTQRGPEGYVKFEEEPDGNWTVTVNVTEWNAYKMLWVYAFNDPYTEQRYLHPGDESVTLTDVPAKSFVDLHIPVEQRYGFGYLWQKEYWLNQTVSGNTTDRYEADVLVVAVDQNYTTKAEENQESKESDKN